MSHDTPAYGLWMLVIFNSAIFIMFAFSFFKPQTARDWRTLYGRLAVTEEAEMQSQFGEVFARYAQGTPRFIPRWPGANAVIGLQRPRSPMPLVYGNHKGADYEHD